MHLEVLVFLLQAAGINRLSTRKEWPLEVLKQVLGSLTREVPGNMLEQQIWSGSVSSHEWWRRQQQHTRSTAVMCMVGLPRVLRAGKWPCSIVHICFNDFRDYFKATL